MKPPDTGGHILTAEYVSSRTGLTTELMKALTYAYLIDSSVSCGTRFTIFAIDSL